MASIILLLLLGSLISVSLTNGGLNTSRPSITLAEVDVSASTSAPYLVTCDSEYSCLNCTAVQICAPVAGGQSFKQVAVVGCHGATPWCDPDSGTCSPDETLACAESAGVIVSDFICMRDGHFPDLTDCSKFYHCVGGVATMFECLGKNHHYIPHYQACRFPSKKAHCANNNSPCAGLNGRKAPIVATDNLFFECAGGKPFSVDRCIGAYVFSNASQTCEPACPRAGLFPSDEDCTKYYRCSLATTAPSETALVQTLNLTCPTGQGFLEEAMQCVDKSLVPNCQVEYPELFN